MTLYGLPFITVEVPNRIDLRNPPTSRPFNPPAATVPAPQQQNQGTFTRLITVTNTFAPIISGMAPSVTATIQDSFGGTTVVESLDQSIVGMPILPMLSYDITLNPTTSAQLGAGDGIPQPRGVRLMSAISEPTRGNHLPRMTSLISSGAGGTQRDEASLPNQARDLWLPATPYSYERIATMGTTDNEQINDLLVISPLQFRAINKNTSEVRAFTSMVFEVTYIDPRRAAEAQISDRQPPLLQSPAIKLLPAKAVVRGKNAVVTPAQLRFSIEASDDYSTTVAANVTYTLDGKTWQSSGMTRAADGSYELFVDAPKVTTQVYVVFEARDDAGNVATESAKGGPRKILK